MAPFWFIVYGLKERLKVATTGARRPTLVALAAGANAMTWKGASAGVPGLAYNKLADQRSWESMTAFFKEIFGA